MPVAPPRPKLPPLNALRAFEAAARLGGFRAAGDELCVTPGAVAQQVKGLESYLGAALFEREPRGVRLTGFGIEALDALGPVFDDLGAAIQAMRARAWTGTVQIATLPGIAQLWLGPRLAVLHARVPGLKLSVTALETPPNLAREPIDYALFFGGDGRVVTHDRLVAVAAPAVAQAVAEGADIADFPWISDASWADDWPRWLAAAGRRVAVPKGPVHSLYALAVEEAVRGAGILVGHSALVGRHIAAGALVPLPGPQPDTGSPLTLASPHDLTGTGPMAEVAHALLDKDLLP